MYNLPASDRLSFRAASTRIRPGTHPAPTPELRAQARSGRRRSTGSAAEGVGTLSNTWKQVTVIVMLQLVDKIDLHTLCWAPLWRSSWTWAWALLRWRRPRPWPRPRRRRRSSRRSAGRPASWGCSTTRWRSSAEGAPSAAARHPLPPTLKNRQRKENPCLTFTLLYSTVPSLVQNMSPCHHASYFWKGLLFWDVAFASYWRLRLASQWHHYTHCLGDREMEERPFTHGCFSSRDVWMMMMMMAMLRRYDDTDAQ